MVLGATWWSRGDRVLGAGFAALAMLLASPMSWSHHWVWAVPIALAVWRYGRWVSVLWIAVFVSRMFVWPPWRYRREYARGPIEHLLGNAYVLAALALGVWGAVLLIRSPGPPARSA